MSLRLDPDSICFAESMPASVLNLVLKPPTGACCSFPCRLRPISPHWGLFQRKDGPTMNTRRRERIIDEVEAAGWIESGMTIAIGMPTPYAVVRQIIRRGLKDLTVVDSGFSLDLLIGAGCVRKVVSYYAGGGFGNPVTPMFRRAAERGEIEVWECEEGILGAGLQAAAQMLPFVPWRGGAANQARRYDSTCGDGGRVRQRPACRRPRMD